MAQLVFASSNAHKIEEVSAILGSSVELTGLEQIGIHHDLIEDADTLEGNARRKAWQVWEWSGKNCFADDTGLEVEALNGAPGVYSARFAGPQRNNAENRARLLRELDGKTNRRARFRTVFCLIQDGREYLFEGIVEGVILNEERGSGGFGYDALFCPEGSERSFAEMTPEEKNALSHRARAAEKMAEFLKKG